MNVFDLFAKITIDTSNYEDGLEKASKQNENAKSSIKSVGSAANTLRNQIGVLEGQYSEAQKEVKRLSEEFNKSAKETGLTSKETKDLAGKLKEAQDKAAGLKKELDETRVKAGQFGDVLKNGLATAAKVATAAFAELSAAAIAFAKTSIDTGMQFDAFMSQIAATIGLSTEDIKNNVNGAGDTFEALRAKAIEMGSTTNFTAQQAAEGLNILAMSGYDAEESMSMIEDVLHLAAAGSMDMASAAGYVSGSMKGFNDSTKDAAYYADLMARGATLANTSVAQLGDAMAGSSATASSYGQSAETVTLALLRLAEQGEIGSAASTALAAAMKNLYAPTDQAKKLLTELGVQAFDESTGKARDFNDVVNELSGALSGYSDEQKTSYAQTIFGIQGFDAYNKMAVTSIEKQNEWSAAIAQSSGEAANQYNTMTDNLVGDLDIFNSALDGVKIAFSDQLTPALRNGVQHFTSLAESAQKFIEDGGVDKIIQLFTDLSPVIAAATAAMVVFKTASAIATVIKGVTEALNGQTVSWGLLNAIMEANIFVKVATLIAAVGTALVTLYMTNEDFRNKVNAAWNTVKDTISNVVSAIVTFLAETVPNAAQTAVDWFKSIPDQMKEVGSNLITGLWNGITDKAEWLKGKVSGVVDTIKGWFTGKEGFDEHSPSKWSQQVFRYVMEGGGEGLEEGLPGLMGNVSSVVNSVKSGMDFGTANVDFASSGISQSSAAIINSVSSGENGNAPVIPLTINLLTGDANPFAQWILPDLIRAADAAGTPIASGQYA